MVQISTGSKQTNSLSNFRSTASESEREHAMHAYTRNGREENKRINEWRKKEMSKKERNERKRVDRLRQHHAKKINDEADKKNVKSNTMFIKCVLRYKCQNSMRTHYQNPSVFSSEFLSVFFCSNSSFRILTFYFKIIS